MYLSVIVPIYGVEKYIERCAVSLFEQTVSDLEFIFVDDCSPDDSVSRLKSVIDRYPSRKPSTHVIRHNVNKGLAAARNTGIEHSTGEYVMHVDSDDWIAPNTCGECLKIAEKDDADVVLFDVTHEFKDKISIEPQREGSSKEGYIGTLLVRRNVLCVCGGIYRRSLYLDNQIEAIPGLNFGEDYSVKPRLMYHAKKISFLHEPFYHYNHTNESSYTAGFRRKDVSSLKLAWNVLDQFFSDKGEGYGQAVRLAEMCIKADLLHLWGVNNGSEEDYQFIQESFEGFSMNGLSWKHRIILTLSHHKMLPLLKAFSTAGFKLKQYFK